MPSLLWMVLPVHFCQLGLQLFMEDNLSFVSVSQPFRLQRIGITYQVDVVLGIGDIVPLPENQASHITTFFHCYHFRFTH
jgi:hypothetical protein